MTRLLVTLTRRGPGRHLDQGAQADDALVPAQRGVIDDRYAFEQFDSGPLRGFPPDIAAYRVTTAASPRAPY